MVPTSKTIVTNEYQSIHRYKARSPRNDCYTKALPSHCIKPSAHIQVHNDWPPQNSAFNMVETATARRAIYSMVHIRVPLYAKLKTKPIQKQLNEEG
jgi:hypothetical protein